MASLVSCVGLGHTNRDTITTSHNKYTRHPIKT